MGHSTGGGDHGTKRVAKAVLVAAVPPIMLKSAANSEGLPMEHFGINVRDDEWLGEMGVIKGRSRNATARAAADGEVEVLTARQFLERVSSEPALARDLILRLSIRLRRIEDKIAGNLLPFAHDCRTDIRHISHPQLWVRFFRKRRRSGQENQTCKRRSISVARVI